MVSSSEKKTVSINPATQEVIGHTVENTVDELNAAVQKSLAAQKTWGQKTYGERKKHLLRIRDAIVDNAEKIADIITRSNGKARVDALGTEVLPAAMAVTYYAKNAESILARKRLRGGSLLTINKRSYVDRVPFGVVGIISPWNYPFAIPFHEVAMGLITGNGVILKVPSQSSEVGKMIRDCVHAGQLPDGLFALINIPGKIAGDAFMNSGINKLFFTGSVAVGKELMGKAAHNLIPLSLELGGNDAMIVCNDADLDRAVYCALWAGLSNTGQSCAAIERIYVEAGIYESFIQKLKDRVTLLRIGVDTDCNVEIGSLTTEAQLYKVKKLVSDATSAGAYAFAPGSLPIGNGWFYPPTVLENVNDSMRIMNEEIFGPVLPVTKVDTIHEAIERANKSSLGLAASVWSRNKFKAHAIASQLEVGSVMINDHLMSHGLAETPWGGFKQSGIGRTHGYIGLEEMTQPRVVIDDIVPLMKRNMWWYPYSRKVFNGLLGGLQFLYSKNPLKKLSGGMQLVRVFMRSFTGSWK